MIQTEYITGTELNEKLNDAYRLISEEAILRLAAKDAAVSNVANGLCKDCFGIWCDEEDFSPNYTLVYINGEGLLQGEAINLNIEDKYKFDITMAFCNHLTKEYKHLDLIDVFNTYSYKLRSYLELFDYRTISDKEMSEIEGENVTFIAKAKGILYVPQIDKLKLYRDFFDNNYNYDKPKDENVVYLLLDLNTSHIKIGRSKTIMHREKTLQSQSPKIETIAFWKAPKATETFLHKTFVAKRLRGEWFKLNFSDLNHIKELMTQYA
ncbi:GIY-YIG nuclease family protein [Parafilimonas terrae]|uniref:Meiotically up-regulated gene 113 n=1 Tax=Parafilimonas terrae TaxID=1465490 RepID=A0A1I5XFW3_9BACT|nr:GIY-YIG nuclease family protein [Parafilimonas terrae]SFQ30848.1 Meiotically up-regulated gene 113 [Parafilimonas terrae]